MAAFRGCNIFLCILLKYQLINTYVIIEFILAHTLMVLIASYMTSFYQAIN